MQTLNISNRWQHSHIFDEGNSLAEKKTRWAVLLTFVTMVAEIVGGWRFNSMALLADGWHMSSHALALGLSVLAYAAARRFARDSRFAFGTWKIEILGGYTSALFLVGVAGLMMYQSVERLLTPSAIRYDEAIALASIGLMVNLVCAWLLRHDHSHHDHHHRDHGAHGAHSHDHGEHHHDLNLRSAYLHVIADATTSALAIVALFGGKFWDARWLDPAMGIVGAVMVLIWAYGLLRDTGRVLLDAEMDTPVVAEIRELISELPEPAEITDLHVWRVGKGKYACIVSLLTATVTSINADEIRRRLGIHEELAHITVEINHRT